MTIFANVMRFLIMSKKTLANIVGKPSPHRGNGPDCPLKIKLSRITTEEREIYRVPVYDYIL